MAFCGSCGGQLAAGAAFCAACGAPAASGARQARGSRGPTQDVELIKPRVRTRLPGFVKKTLHPTEQVLCAFKVSLFDHHREHDLRHDKIALTDQRIIYYRTALIHKSMGEMSYRALTGVHYNRGVIHGTVVVDAANAGLTLRGIGNDDAAFAEKIISMCAAGRPFRVK